MAACRQRVLLKDYPHTLIVTISSLSPSLSETFPASTSQSASPTEKPAFILIRISYHGRATLQPRTPNNKLIFYKHFSPRPALISGAEEDCEEEVWVFNTSDSRQPQLLIKFFCFQCCQLQIRLISE